MTGTALLLALLAGLPPGGRTGPPAVLPPDSSDIHDEARDAQARFERLRRGWLPVDRSWPSGGPCDEVVGRICLRYDEGDDWYPGPEDPRVTRARDDLLTVLARTSRALPGDGWILGQRVFYLVEAGREDEAVRAASACGGVARWWCDALEGYALHVAGRFQEAAAAFREALAGIAPDQARAWRDPDVLLDGDGHDVLERAEDEGRWDAAVRRIWDLGDPLYLVEGNDRWTAHMARHVVDRIRERARTPWTISWGSDMAELDLRYGWEVGWERREDDPLHPLEPQGVVGHHDPEGRSYLPEGSALEDPAASAAEAWGTGRQEARSTYTPAYAPVTLPGEGQVALFPRGERVVVVASETLPADTTFHGKHHHAFRDSVPPRWRGRSPEAGLFLVPVGEAAAGGPDPDSGGPPGLRARTREGTDSAALVLGAPAGAYLLSAETWSPDLRRAGRIRRGVRVPAAPPDVPTLSDLLLLTAEGPEGESLEAAAARALPRAWLRSGERVAVGWEVYGLGWRPEAIAYRLSIRGGGGNLLQKAGRLLGLVGDDRPLTLEWQEEGPDAPGPVFRSVALDLPSLDPGRYTLRLELATKGRSPLVSERRLEIRAAPASGG